MAGLNTSIREGQFSDQGVSPQWVDNSLGIALEEGANLADQALDVRDNYLEDSARKELQKEAQFYEQEVQGWTAAQNEQRELYNQLEGKNPADRALLKRLIDENASTITAYEQGRLKRGGLKANIQARAAELIDDSPWLTTEISRIAAMQVGSSSGGGSAGIGGLPAELRGRASGAELAHKQITEAMVQEYPEKNPDDPKQYEWYHRTIYAPRMRAKAQADVGASLAANNLPGAMENIQSASNTIMTTMTKDLQDKLKSGQLANREAMNMWLTAKTQELDQMYINFVKENPGLGSQQNTMLTQFLDNEKAELTQFAKDASGMQLSELDDSVKYLEARGKLNTPIITQVRASGGDAAVQALMPVLGRLSQNWIAKQNLPDNPFMKALQPMAMAGHGGAWVVLKMLENDPGKLASAVVGRDPQILDLLEQNVGGPEYRSITRQAFNQLATANISGTEGSRADMLTTMLNPEDPNVGAKVAAELSQDSLVTDEIQQNPRSATAVKVTVANGIARNLGTLRTRLGSGTQVRLGVDAAGLLVIEQEGGQDPLGITDVIYSPGTVPELDNINQLLMMYDNPDNADALGKTKADMLEWILNAVNGSE